MIRKSTNQKILFLEIYFSNVLFLLASYKEMKFKAVYLNHSRFMVNKSEKKNKKNDKIALKSQPKKSAMFLVSP